MHNITKSIVVAVLAAVATPAATFADVPTSITQNVPGLMNYQGYLANPSTGAAYVDGIYTLDIRIWDSAASKTGCLWGGKYTVYVKDGYFNLMLGDPNATALTSADGTVPTYKKDELWKALWNSSSNDNVRYLGVTMRQDANHATISSPVEIAPRQQLLTSPFAFRAQSAQYADQAQSTFTVPGKLTVNGGAAFTGTVTLPNDSAVGPLVANTSTVKLTGNTAAAASQPNVYDVGKYLYFYSYYNMAFAPTAGNITFTVPSGYQMKVSGNKFVSEANMNSIGGTGSTAISGSSVNLSTTGGNAKMSLSASTTSVTGATVTVSSSNAMTVSAGGTLYLKSASKVIGKGSLSWESSDGMQMAPFRLFKIRVTISGNASGNMGSYDFSSKFGSGVLNNYRFVVVGHDGLGWDVSSVHCNGTNVEVRLVDANSSTRYVYVTVMGIHKDFTIDHGPMNY